MPKGPEGRFTAWLTKLLVEDGAIVIPLVGGTLGSSGWPDRLVWHRDWHGLLELKGPKTKLGDRQRANIAKLCKRRPGSAYVVRARDDLQSGTVIACVLDVVVGIGTFTTAAGLIGILRGTSQQLTSEVTS